MQVDWKYLELTSQLEEIKKESFEKPVGIFKHSTRCSISAAALSRFERSWDQYNKGDEISMYFLNLLKHRDISNQIAVDFEVSHESPQFILLKNGQAVYHASHFGINLDTILSEASSV